MKPDLRTSRSNTSDRGAVFRKGQSASEKAVKGDGPCIKATLQKGWEER